MSETNEGCSTKHGFACRTCVGNWLEDYLRMVNPFVHLQGKESFKLNKEDIE